MCSGPFRGASGTQQLARLHRKGPHRLGAWRSGPLSKPRRLCAIYHKLYDIRNFCISQFTKHRHQSTHEIHTGVLFKQVLDSHRCSIPQSCTFERAAPTAADPKEKLPSGCVGGCFGGGSPSRIGETESWVRSSPFHCVLRYVSQCI